MIRPATDAEIVAHVEANSEDAAMLKFSCGDHDIRPGTFEVCDVVFCNECQEYVHITGVVSTAIVHGM